MDDLKTLDILLDALKALDELLVSENQQPIEIHAIDGFALAFRNIRADGLTRDIDTITPDYPPNLARLIVKVAELIGLEDDWLNNDAVGSIDGLTSRDAVIRHDAMLDARYQKCRKTPFFRYGDIRRIGVSRYAYTAARGIP